MSPEDQSLLIFVVVLFIGVLIILGLCLFTAIVVGFSLPADCDCYCP